MEWMILASLAPVAARLIGEAMAAGDYAKAEELRQKAMAEYDIALPDLKEIEAIEQQQSELGKVRADAGYKGAEDQVLGSLMKQGTTPGLTDIDKADLEASQAQALGTERGMRGAHEQRLRMRGQAGTGAALAGSLSAIQSGVQTAHDGAVQTAASAAQRRLDAIKSAGQYATGLRRDDLDQKNLVGDAQDRINRFNTEDRRFSRDYNAGVGQQQFDNQMRRADRRYGAARTRAGDYEDRGDQTVETAVGVGDGVASGAAEYGAYQTKTGRYKKDGKP